MNRGAKFPMLARRIMNFLFWPLYFPHTGLADDKDFSGINLFMMNHWQGKNREDRHVFISSKETLSVSFLCVLSWNLRNVYRGIFISHFSQCWWDGHVAGGEGESSPGFYSYKTVWVSINLSLLQPKLRWHRQRSVVSPDQLISVDIPGLLEASRGYDTPSGNPHPGRGSTDPGLRKQIFQPMMRDHDGHYTLDGRFVTGNEQVRALPYLVSSPSHNANSFRWNVTQSLAPDFMIK